MNTKRLTPEELELLNQCEGKHKTLAELFECQSCSILFEDTPKLSPLDIIHNQLITYAYNRAEELRKTARAIQDEILASQPSNAVENKPLNLAGLLTQLEAYTRELDKAQKSSTLLYRVIKGLEAPETLIK